MNKQDLRVILELNKRYGQGYQVHLVMDGVFDSTIDAEPFTLDEAYSGAVDAISEISRETGHDYDPFSLKEIKPCAPSRYADV